MQADTTAGPCTSRTETDESNGQKNAAPKCVVCGDPADGLCAERGGPVCRYHGRQTPVCDGGKITEEAARVKRHQLTETIGIADGVRTVTGEPDEHISGTVEIELSGAESDLDDTATLLRMIEQSVIDAVEEFGADPERLLEQTGGDD